MTQDLEEEGVAQIKHTSLSIFVVPGPEWNLDACLRFESLGSREEASPAWRKPVSSVVLGRHQAHACWVAGVVGYVEPRLFT